MSVSCDETFIIFAQNSVSFQILKKTDGKKEKRQAKLALCFEKHVINARTY